VAVIFGSVSANHVLTGTVTSVTCPTGTVTGDLLVFFACNDGPNIYSSWDATLTPLYVPNATDFTADAGHQQDLGSASWFRFATPSDVAGTTTYSATKAGTASTQPNLMVCVRYGGALGSFAAGTATLNSSTPSAIASNWAYRQGFTPGVTYGVTGANTACPAPVNPSGTINATDLVLRAYVFGSDATNSGFTMSAAPAGWTQRGSGSTITSDATKFNVGMLICDRLGVTDTGTATASVAGNFDIYTASFRAVPPPQPPANRARIVRASNW